MRPVNVVLGASGHVGSAVASSLLELRQPVTVVLRDEKKAESWRGRGAEIALLDVRDTEALRHLLQQAKRAFLLNPPAPPDSDTSAEEHTTVRSLLAALKGVHLERVVAASTYGAQPGEHNGDLGPLYELERGVLGGASPAAVLRGAYYFSNWDPALKSARAEGVLSTLYPADFVLPMVAPADLGAYAANLMLRSDAAGLVQMEGPRRYSPQDVADALGEVLGKPVKVVTTPRDQWAAALAKLGFSPAAAQSFIRMTELTLASPLPEPSAVERGVTSLTEYLRSVASAAD